MTLKTKQRPVVLCLLDGWGYRTETTDNAISLATTPVWDQLTDGSTPNLLETSGPAVGLPEGQMGNSEVGHMTIGAGRVILQDLPRIDTAIANGTLAENPALLELVERLQGSGGRCHLMGLLSPGGVHAHQNHIVELSRIVAQHSITVIIHAFLDGRDTPPRSAADYIEAFEKETVSDPRVTIGTISGRYFSMDRDMRWERVIRTFDAVVQSKGHRANSTREAISSSYDRGVSDEFIEPTIIGN